MKRPTVCASFSRPTSSSVAVAALAMATMTATLAGSACNKQGNLHTAVDRPGSGGRSGTGGAGGNRDAGLKPADAPLDGPGDAADTGNTCAEEIHKTEARPVDLLLLVDRTYSADWVLPGTDLTRFILARQGLLSFLRDPRSAGLNVALQFLPWASQTPVCTQDSDCPGPIINNCLPAKICTGVLIQACGSVAGATGPDDCGPDKRCKMGQCNLTGRDCYELDKTCDSGVPGDTCKPLPRLCRGYSFQCDYEVYKKPNFDFAPLPAMAPALSERLLHTPAAGLHFTGPAVAGSLEVLKERLKAQPPGRRGVLLFVTDGLPDITCLPPSATLVADLMAEALADTPSVQTFIIGMLKGTGDESAKIKAGLEEMAQKGGSKAPFFVYENESFVDKFQAALDEVRGRALPCAFDIPATMAGAKGPIDFAKVNVHWKGQAGDESVPYVAKAEACDPMRGGWYYDADPATGGMPKQVLTCESTCKRMKADATASVELRYGCKTVTID